KMKFKNNIGKLICLVLIISSSGYLSAKADDHTDSEPVFVGVQQRVVTGHVTDIDGQPLQGVTVSVKGAPGGTTTDAEGAYSLSIAGDNETLVFASLGYLMKEVAVP